MGVHAKSVRTMIAWLVATYLVAISAYAILYICYKFVRDEAGRTIPVDEKVLGFLVYTSVITIIAAVLLAIHAVHRLLVR
jgi:hypothetical protein